MADPVVYKPALAIYRGDTFVKQFTFATKNPDNTTSPVDLTAFGDIWKAQLRSTEDNAVAIDFEVDTTQAVDGIISLSLDASVAAEIPSKGVWDLQATDSTQTPPFVRTLLRGTFTRVKDVSRP